MSTQHTKNSPQIALIYCSRVLFLPGIISLTATLLMGCSHDPKAGYIGQRWSKNVQELSIEPIYPPREAFYPGDIYLTKDAVTDPLDTAVWLGTAMSAEEIKVEMAKRPAFGAVNPMKFANDELLGRYWEQPDNRFNNNAADTERARLVQFPAYQFATSTSGSIGATLPLASIALGIGAGGSSEATLSLTVPTAVYLGVGAAALREKYQTRHCTTITTHAKAIAPQIETKKPLAEDEGIIVLVNEVFYAHAIDYSFSSKTGFSVEAKAAIAVLAELSSKRQTLFDQLSQLLKAKPASTPDTPNIAEKKKEINDAEEAIAQQKLKIQGMTGTAIPAIPGVTASLVTADAYGIKIRENYQRPLAIGYRAIYLSTKCDVAIPSSQNAASPEPSTTKPTSAPSPGVLKPKNPATLGAPRPIVTE
jgi:hypothetical protein